MDERRDEPTPAATPRRSASGARLSPLQEAWAAYRDHTSACDCCRMRGGGRCELAVALWRAHQELCDAAYRALAEVDPRARF